MDFVSSGVWALKFSTDEPWRGGAQILKERETKVTGKREEESERGERRKKRKIKKKKKKWPLGIKKIKFSLTFMLQWAIIDNSSL